MSNEERQVTHSLIQTIHKKDHRFRMAQTVFWVLVTIALIGVIFYQSQTLSAVKNQLVQQKQLSQQLSNSVNDLKSDNTAQLNKLNQHIDCVTKFFAQPDRNDLKISDLNNCSLSKDGTIQSSAPVHSSLSVNTVTSPAASQTEPTQVSSSPAAPPEAASSQSTPIDTPLESVSCPVMGIISCGNNNL